MEKYIIGKIENGCLDEFVLGIDHIIGASKHEVWKGSRKDVEIDSFLIEFHLKGGGEISWKSFLNQKQRDDFYDETVKLLKERNGNNV